MSTRRTLAARVAVETPPVKGSRFHGVAAPVDGPDAARALVAEVRAAHPKATHVASAWRMSADRHAYDDDGEPAGTAGRPLLDRLVGQDLEGVVLAVVRYYGGTKLGKGGLVRAYGGCGSAALAAAAVVEQEVTASIRVTCAHGLVGALRGVVVAHGGRVTDASWGAEASFTVVVSAERAEACRAALVDRAAGRIQLG